MSSLWIFPAFCVLDPLLSSKCVLTIILNKSMIFEEELPYSNWEGLTEIIDRKYEETHYEIVRRENRQNLYCK